ncbi:hypothetical protein DKY64_24055, partial [Stenotrophomonas maltophilia]
MPLLETLKLQPPKAWARDGAAAAGKPPPKTSPAAAASSIAAAAARNDRSAGDEAPAPEASAGKPFELGV